MPCIF